LAFAINQRPVGRDASSIAQTDVHHFADEEVMHNSRASLAEVARSTGFSDYRDSLKLPSVVATISSEKPPILPDLSLPSSGHERAGD
jgi:hypothetical protein